MQIATMTIDNNSSQGMNFIVSIPTRKTFIKNLETEYFDTDRLVSIKDVV